MFSCIGMGVAANIPSGGDPVRFETVFVQWRMGGSRQDAGATEVVAVSGKPFREALQVEVKERTEREYDMVLSGGDIKGQIGKGDVLLCSFYARCLESSDESALGQFSATIRAKYPGQWLHPFTKTYSVGKEWKQFLIPFEAPVDNRDGYEISFPLGGVKPQTLQFAGMEVVNYRDTRKLSELPMTETYYAGMEPDAPWRKAAGQRIEKHRKADLCIAVVDRSGQPVPDATVHAVLKNHAYGFGVAVAPHLMFNERDPDSAQAYRDAIGKLFNKAVFENSMKWKVYQDNDAQLEKAIAWFAERQIPLRGHCMVWPAWQRLPEGMQEEWGTKTNEFRSVVEEHVRKMATTYPDTFAEWDIVNEPYTQHELIDMLGREAVADWFRIAKQANPDFKCYINDYAILSGDDEAHRNGYYEWIRYLLAQGAPVEGIGLQGHYRAPVPPEEILNRLDRFAEFGLEMQITEYDFEETDELLQARFTRDFMTAVFSHPQTVGIVTWCLWEPAAWKPSAAFFSSDWKKKRIAQAWEHMIKQEWKTDATIRTDDEGIAAIRGFLGDYEIMVKAGDRKATVLKTLKQGQGRVVIEI